MDLETIQKLVTQVVENYFTSLKTGNVSRILELYADNAEIIPHGAPAITGKSAIEKSYSKGSKSIKLYGEMGLKSIDIFKNIAIVRCEEPSQIELLKEGSKINTYFRELFVLEKNYQTERWEILKYMFSQNPDQAQ